MLSSGHLAFIGTYTRGGSRGIYAVRLDPVTGALSIPELVAETGNPTFLALSPDRRRLYAVRDSEAMAAAFQIEAAGSLKPLPSPPAGNLNAPCHVAVDKTGRMLVVTNYHRGFIASLAIRPDGTLGEPRIVRHEGRSVHPVRQTEPHPHSTTISPDNGHALVCDLGLDRILVYRIDPDGAALAPVDPPFAAVAPGSGPRHFTFSRDGSRAYVVNEIASTIVGFRWNAAAGTLTAFQTLSTLPPGFAGANTAAEIAVHPGGRFLYASNRGHDSIAVFAVAPETGALSPVEHASCGGRGPRHFALTPDGRWLVCANQDSGALVSFAVDAASGKLTGAGGSAAVPTPVCVLFHG